MDPQHVGSIAPEEAFQPGQAVHEDHGQARAQRSLGIVLVGYWRTEYREDGLAGGAQD